VFINNNQHGKLLWIWQYRETYETGFQLTDGTTARVFSSADKTTTDLYFHWAREYGIDGFFMQRFFSYLRDTIWRGTPDKILSHALEYWK